MLVDSDAPQEVIDEARRLGEAGNYLVLSHLCEAASGEDPAYGMAMDSGISRSPEQLHVPQPNDDPIKVEDGGGKKKRKEVKAKVSLYLV